MAGSHGLIGIRAFSNESVLCIRWPKYWRFSFSIISLSSEFSGLISFRIDWFDLLAVQGTLKSLLQQHSSKASILRCSAFFTVQLSHPYVTTGKTIAMTRWTFVGKVMSLLLNMPSRLVCIFFNSTYYSTTQIWKNHRHRGPTINSMWGAPLHGGLVPQPPCCSKVNCIYKSPF